MSLKKNYLLLAALAWSIGLSQVASAQEEISTIKTFLQKAQQAYSQADRLGFNVQYRYANLNRPNQFIDSVAGEVQMHQRRFRFSIDGVTTITTDHYTIQVIEEEKLIYLSKASNTGMLNPVNVLDSTFTHTKGLQSSLKEEGNMVTLTMQLPPGGIYKKISMTMDKKTGFFQKAMYELYTESFVGSEWINSPGNPAPYQSSGLVEVLFSHYQQGKYDESLFREDQYFTRQEGNFETAGRYKDYRIFLASSNL